jgi:hypothetical protein
MTIKTIKEFISSWYFLVTCLIDIIYIIATLSSQSYDTSPKVITGILVVGVLGASFDLVYKKNRLLQAFELKFPAIGLYLRRREQDRVLRVRNTNTFSLKNIQLSSIEIDTLLTYRFSMEGTNILAPNEERDITTESGSQLGNLAHFTEEYGVENYEIKVTFNDFDNNTFIYTFNIGKDGIFITSQERR